MIKNLRCTLKLKNLNKLILIVSLSLGLIVAGFSPKVEASQVLEVVMLGDSLTAGFNWSTAFPEITIHNLGISGDTTEAILKRLDQVRSLKPELIFLQVGINDFGRKNRAQAIIDGHLQIWDKLKGSLPETKLIITSLLPVRTPKGTGSYQDWNRAIGQLNARLQAEAKKQGLSFIDLFPALSDDQNQLDQKFTTDGLHLRGLAYNIWIEALTPYIEQEQNRAP